MTGSIINPKDFKHCIKYVTSFVISANTFSLAFLEDSLSLYTKCIIQFFGVFMNLYFPFST